MFNSVFRRAAQQGAYSYARRCLSTQYVLIHMLYCVHMYCRVANSTTGKSKLGLYIGASLVGTAVALGVDSYAKVYLFSHATTKSSHRTMIPPLGHNSRRM